jgi:hypothetical protein
MLVPVWVSFDAKTFAFLCCPSDDTSLHMGRFYQVIPRLKIFIFLYWLSGRIDQWLTWISPQIKYFCIAEENSNETKSFTSRTGFWLRLSLFWDFMPQLNRGGRVSGYQISICAMHFCFVYLLHCVSRLCLACLAEHLLFKSWLPVAHKGLEWSSAWCTLKYRWTCCIQNNARTGYFSFNIRAA